MSENVTGTGFSTPVSHLSVSNRGLTNFGFSKYLQFTVEDCHQKVFKILKSKKVRRLTLVRINYLQSSFRLTKVII